MTLVTASLKRSVENHITQAFARKIAVIQVILKDKLKNANLDKNANSMENISELKKE